MPEKQIPTPKTDETIDDKRGRFVIELAEDASNLNDVREEANEDTRFINVTGGMWEGFLEEQFGKRAKLQFDIISNFINRFLGQWNQNRVGVEFKPNDAKTSDEDADLLNGIYRADYRENSGKLSVDNAVDEVATCGYGVFKLAPRFEDDGDPENDLQRIEWRPKFNAYNSVFWDTAAQRIDKRDAMHCTEISEYTTQSFKRAYPDHNPVSVFDPRTFNSFYNDNGSTSFNVEKIYIATRYEVVRKLEKVFVYNNLSTEQVEVYNQADHKEIESQLKEDSKRQFVREREVVVQHVEKSVFNGEEFLEKPRRIAGKWIPLIPMYGYRGYVDGKEWYRGLVRKLKDAARMFNMQISQLAENAASAGQEVPIFDPDQMAGGIGDLWADKNNKPYLLARALKDQDGNIVHQGPIGYSKPPVLDQSTAELMQIVPSFVNDTTGGAQQDTIDPRSSGKAINAIQKREDLNTQQVFDNIANAIEWSGEVYASMAAEIYTTPRIFRTIGQDGTESTTQLMKTVLDNKTGRPITANTLNGKKFRVYADIGPQYDSMREQTVEDLKGMLEAIGDRPGGEQYVPIIMATIMDNIAGTGLDALKEFNRKIMLEQGIVKPANDEEAELLQELSAPKEPSAQDKLLESAAVKEAAEARNLDASATKNAALAEKAIAETAEIVQETQLAPVKSLLEIRKQTFANASQGLQ